MDLAVQPSRRILAFQDRTGVAVDVRSAAYIDRWLRDADGALPLPVLDRWYRAPSTGLILPVECAIALVNSSTASSGGAAISGGGSMDTSGANFIVVAVAEFGTTPSIVSDNKGNGNYTNLASFGDAGSYRCHIAYKYNASVGAGHTFSTDQANFPAIVILACSGVQSASDPYDTTAGTAGAKTADSGATAVAGSLTATAASSLYFTVFVNSQTSTGSTTPSGFSVTGFTNHNVANALECAAAYQISSSALNPSWTHGASGAFAASQAIFAPSSGGGGGGRGLFRTPPVSGVGIGGSFFRDPLQAPLQAIRKDRIFVPERYAA